MDHDRFNLCVLCVLGGAIEIPRIHAPAHPDLLRAFAVNQTQSSGPTRNASGPEKDPVWTRFFVVSLLGVRCNSINCNHLHAAPPSGEEFSAYRSPKTRNGSPSSTSHPREAMLQMLRNV